MDVFLAGICETGNLKKMLDIMECYLASVTDERLYPPLLHLAGEHSAKNGKIMEMYLAGENGKSKIMDNEVFEFLQKIKSPLWDNISVLESFFYVKDNRKFPILYRGGAFKKILLDSGAYTFLSSAKSSIDWERYVGDYADFINKYDVRLFFELDIDKIIGLDKVEKLRDKLESLTGKKPIPVWHKNRGKDYFVEMCKKYPYVALGGYVSKEIPSKVYENYFPWFIRTAHQNGVKIHGLGYTRTENLKKYRFDSVDSTAWLHGNIGGFVYKFDCKRGFMGKEQREKKTRVKSQLAAIYNFNEWLKFQDYARKFL